MKRDDLLSFAMRRQQGPQDAARRGRGDGCRRRHARDVRRHPVEPCARDGRGGRGARSGRHARPERPPPGSLRPAMRGSIDCSARRARRCHAGRSRAGDGPRRGRSRGAGRRPFIVPLGASTPTGALGFARGISEIAAAGLRPDVIVHASSSGGTQAGLIAGCALFGLRAAHHRHQRRRVAAASRARGAHAARGHGASGSARGRPASAGDRPIEIDDRFVGAGYGIPTPALDRGASNSSRVAKASCSIRSTLRRRWPV